MPAVMGLLAGLATLVVLHGFSWLRRTQPRGTAALAVAVAASALVIPAAAPPAGAHNSESSRYGVVYAGHNQCVFGHDKQNHGGGVLSRSNETVSTVAAGNLCGGAYTVEPGMITHRADTYKAIAPGQPGQLCVRGTWQYSPTRSYNFHQQTNTDIWHQCNNGSGVHVYITQDVWHGVWGANVHFWLMGSWRPSTGHCHCP